MHYEMESKVPYLNNGGCVHFANFFSKKLTELGIEHSIIYFNYERVGRTYFTFSPVAHVAVKIKNVGVVDGFRTRSQSDFKKRYGNAQIRDFDLDLISKYCGWNPSYSLSYNKKVKSIINKYFNDN